MVRINLIRPEYLADQHLVAEYCEILILMDYARRYPKIENIPENYCLGKGHITFFKNKLAYLKKRHELLKTEMKNRKFKPNKTINLNDYQRKLVNDWQPREKDYRLIRQRIKEKIKLKPEFYRYYGRNRPLKFLLALAESS